MEIAVVKALAEENADSPTVAFLHDMRDSDAAVLHPEGKPPLPTIVHVLWKATQQCVPGSTLNEAPRAPEVTTPILDQAPPEEVEVLLVLEVPMHEKGSTTPKKKRGRKPGTKKWLDSVVDNFT